MLPASKPLDLDARWLYRRSFLLFFVMFEMLVWHRLQRFPMRAPQIECWFFCWPGGQLHALFC